MAVYEVLALQRRGHTSEKPDRPQDGYAYKTKVWEVAEGERATWTPERAAG